MRKFTVAILLLAAMRVSAQESAGESAALPFLNQIRSAVSAGSAGVMMKPDAYAHFGNVADAVYGEKKMAAGVSYSLWQPDVTHANIFSVSASYKLNDKMAVTVGASTSLYRKDGKYDELGIRTAEMQPVDVLAGAGFAYKIIDGLSAGAALNYVMSKNIAGTANAFAADVQVAFRRNGLDLSVAACNLGMQVKDEGGAGYQLPMNARLNAGYGFGFGKSRLYGALQGRYYFGGPSAVAGGVALEYEWNGMLSVRAGMSEGQKKNGVPSYAAAGVSLKLGGICIDLAYSAMASGPMKNTLACGIGYSF